MMLQQHISGLGTSWTKARVTIFLTISCLNLPGRVSDLLKWLERGYFHISGMGSRVEKRPATLKRFNCSRPGFLNNFMFPQGRNIALLTAFLGLYLKNPLSTFIQDGTIAVEEPDCMNVTNIRGWTYVMYVSKLKVQVDLVMNISAVQKWQKNYIPWFTLHTRFSTNKHNVCWAQCNGDQSHFSKCHSL